MQNTKSKSAKLIENCIIYVDTKCGIDMVIKRIINLREWTINPILVVRFGSFGIHAQML
jgi:hypothetical protein